MQSFFSTRPCDLARRTVGHLAYHTSLEQEQFHNRVFTVEVREQNVSCWPAIVAKLVIVVINMGAKSE